VSKQAAWERFSGEDEDEDFGDDED